MAETFKNLAGTIAGSLTTIYTAPSGAQVTISMLQVSNIDGTAGPTVDAQVTDTSMTDTGYLAKNVIVPDGAPVNLLGGKLFMEAGDIIKLGCSSSSSCDYNMSYLEMT